ncbi:MAG: sigma-70 family RNA polymerase sigma factor [Pedosphaera sp.]|nr:sigma-70 family RNA polymerase sigma factor [Pedosphaera sp.]
MKQSCLDLGFGRTLRPAARARMIDTAQYEDFVRAHQDLVYGLAYRLLGNDADARDASQQAFLRAWEHWGEIVGSSTAAAWLKTVTRNLCINHLQRYRARWRFFSEFTSEDGSESGERELPFAAPDTLDQTVYSGGQRQVVEDALAMLPDDQRAALVLYHFEDMDYVDIARQLGVSLGKVKTDIHRARTTLRKKLQPMQEELGF